MFFKMNSLKYGIGFVFVALVVSGCVSGERVNLVSNGTVTLERVPTKGLYVSSAEVFQKGEDVIVSGRVTCRNRNQSSVMGHIDITLLSSDGKVIKQTYSSHAPKRIPNTRNMSASFTKSLGVMPPKNSIIRVKYHKERNSKCKDM